MGEFLSGSGVLPPELLADPGFQRACRERDFAVVFRLARKRAGLYPSRIAHVCDLTPSRVGEIMAGRRRLAHIDVIERVADGLGIPGGLLGLAQRPWEVPAVASVDPPQTGPLAASAPEEPQQTEVAGLLALADGRVTRSTVAALESSVQDYWRRDDEHGGAVLRPAVVGHLQYVTGLMGGPHRAPVLRDLRVLAAELARLAGWAYFDARQYATARCYFRQALADARQLEDQAFLANVLSCMSLQATYEGSAADAVALAAAAQDAVRDFGEETALMMAVLAMREAFAHAVLRDAPACHDALDRATTAFTRANEGAARGCAEPASWAGYFDETKLIVDTGIALARLGKLRRAEPLIAEGLRRERAEQRRGRAFHAFWLADTQLGLGELDRACQSATHALDLASVIDSPRVAGHVKEFQRRLAPWSREEPVVAFEARMRVAFA